MRPALIFLPPLLLFAAPAAAQDEGPQEGFEIFDLVGVSMNLNPDSYRNPGGANAIGRCSTCHMPRTAKTASSIVDLDGFTIEGDIHAHTFDVISPAVSRGMAAAGKDPVPNSCVPCHRGPGEGAWPDYRYKKQ